jgi:hypothetical protein
VGLTTVPISIEGARGYCDWVGRLRRGVQDLMAEGSIPPIPGFDELLALSDRLDRAMRGAADEAERAGRPTLVVDVDFTDQEMRKLSTVGMSMVSYIEILTTRGKLDGAPSPAAMEAIAAIQANMV